MSGRLFQIAELAALVGILASGYLILSSRATAVPVAASDTHEKQQTLKELAGSAPPRAPATTNESTRSPVPLQLSRRTSLEDFQQPATTTEGPITEQQGRKEASDGWAKAIIEADGYRNVRSLVRMSDGRWRGLAMRGAVEVTISVDGEGNVSTE